MNYVSFHVPYIFGNKQNSKSERDQRESRRHNRRQRSLVPGEAHIGPDRPERGKTNSW